MLRIIVILMMFISLSSLAGSPVWTFKPLTPTAVVLPSNGTAQVEYLITNQSTKSHTLTMLPIAGVTQVTTGVGVCANAFVLTSKSSCVLTLQVNGNQLTSSVNDGPIVCQQGSTTQCYRPAASDVLNLSLAPSNCTATADNNIQCTVTIDSQTNFGFTNMTYALCRSAQCDYNGSQTSVSCDCSVISNNDGIDSASTAPNDYNTSKPSGGTVTSTYSRVNSAGEVPTSCASGPFANCFGATCSVTSPSTATCTCPVQTSTYIAPESNCTLVGKIWSATSVASFPAIDGTMLFMYDTFFDGESP